MSKLYRIKTGETYASTTSAVMREHCQRPGRKNPDGSICYFTEQAHKAQTDVNQIISTYDKTGLITHVTKYEAKFGELSGADFKEYQDIITGAQKSFEALPAHVKKRFHQNPAELLAFMDDENNRDEAIKLGLIDASWHVDFDGIGEKIDKPKKKEEVEKDPEVTTES